MWRVASYITGVFADNLANSTEQLLTKTDMTREFTVHRIISKQSDNNRKYKDRLLEFAIPSPDVILFGMPKCFNELSNVIRNQKLTLIDQQFHQAF